MLRQVFTDLPDLFFKQTDNNHCILMAQQFAQSNIVPEAFPPVPGAGDTEYNLLPLQMVIG